MKNGFFSLGKNIIANMCKVLKMLVVCFRELKEWENQEC